jgi:hypothetical protein
MCCLAVVQRETLADTCCHCRARRKHVSAIRCIAESERVTVVVSSTLAFWMCPVLILGILTETFREFSPSLKQNLGTTVKYSPFRIIFPAHSTLCYEMLCLASAEGGKTATATCACSPSGNCSVYANLFSQTTIPVNDHRCSAWNPSCMLT